MYQLVEDEGGKNVNTIPAHHPSEAELLQGLQKHFNDELAKVFDDAKAIVEARALKYDITEPVWHRVKMPLGPNQEVIKKIGRVENLLQRSDDIPFRDLVDQVVEEDIDAINYLAFRVAYLRMLVNTPPIGPDPDPLELEKLVPAGAVVVNVGESVAVNVAAAASATAKKEPEPKPKRKLSLKRKRPTRAGLER